MPQETVTPKPREHMHHCPECDKLKKIVRASLKTFYEQLSLINDYPRCAPLSLDRKDTHKLWNALYNCYIVIRRAVDMQTTKEIQKMTDEEVDEYMNKFSAPEWISGSFFIPPRVPDVPDSVPKLTIIQGGKKNPAHSLSAVN